MSKETKHPDAQQSCALIERFSEDIDLSVSPDFVGIKEEWVEEAESRNKK